MPELFLALITPQLSRDQVKCLLGFIVFDGDLLIHLDCKNH